jgi:hypothetical protein
VVSGKRGEIPIEHKRLMFLKYLHSHHLIDG